MSDRRSARGLLIEAAVIVGSILLAFAIDAWWDERENAERREALLQSLRSDIALARTDLERVLPLADTMVASIISLQRMTGDGPLPESKWARADTLLHFAFIGGSFDPPMGTIEALIGSGELALLRDPVLVGELTALPGRIMDINRETEARLEVYLDFSTDLREDGAGLDIAWTIGELHPDDDRPWRAEPAGAGPLLHTRKYRSHLGLVWALTRNIRADLQEIDASLTVIEERIRE